MHMCPDVLGHHSWLQCKPRKPRFHQVRDSNSSRNYAALLQLITKALHFLAYTPLKHRSHSLSSCWLIGLEPRAFIRYNFIRFNTLPHSFEMYLLVQKTKQGLGPNRRHLSHSWLVTDWPPGLYADVTGVNMAGKLLGKFVGYVGLGWVRHHKFTANLTPSWLLNFCSTFKSTDSKALFQYHSTLLIQNHCRIRYLYLNT